MKELIRNLTEVFSPSGYEQAIRKTIRTLIEPLADEIKEDALGNLIARKGSKEGNGKRIMVAAHMDEIGLMASHIDENGFIRFTNIGTIYPHTLFSGRVRFMNGIQGVIGGEPLNDISNTHSLNQLFIDVGMSNSGSCPIKVGDVAAFERPFIEMGNRMVAKSMDDRVGCAIMIETMRRMEKTLHEIYFTFTTQEELRLRGSMTSAYSIDPDIGISLDVTRTGDTPKSKKMAVNLGDGPAIKIKDEGMISDVRIVNWMISVAEKNKIPYQREILERGTTDARSIQVSRSGVPAGCISIPCRYVHTPSEMVDITDVENSTNLLVKLLEDPFVL